jgi:hypothetical protein
MSRFLASFIRIHYRASRIVEIYVLLDVKDLQKYNEDDDIFNRRGNVYEYRGGDYIINMRNNIIDF